MQYFSDKGLSIETIKTEKLSLLQRQILPWLGTISEYGERIHWRVDDNIGEIMEKYYGDEPYYGELKKRLHHMLGIEDDWQ